MARIAVASDDGSVAEHFGHCQAFILFDVEDGRIIKEERVPNPGHKPGFLPNFLHEQGIAAIIAGGMGGGAIQLFNEKHIQVITGAAGDARKAVEAYAAGRLISSGEMCSRHEHHGGCGG